MGGLSGSAQNESFTRVRIRYHKSAPKKMESKSIRFARIAAFFSLRKVCFSFQKWLEALIQRKTSNHSRLLVFLLWQGMRDSNPQAVG
jgi:hypothetical protein